jgi:thiosulfate dehydrogenase
MKRIGIIMFAVLFMSTLPAAQMKDMKEKDMHDIGPVKYQRERFSAEMHISRGGQLYDNWWKTTLETEKPEKDHPLWKKQTGNKRSGYATYRCKECHGWDYRGKDGAYGRGSHYTGFKGVYGASVEMTVKELEAVLKGSADREHDFTEYLSEEDIEDLALFLKRGVIDVSGFIEADGIPVEGNSEKGRNIFRDNCMQTCHGETGRAINFGSKEEPEFVGTVASGNPWEFIHKVRSGQPGTKMVSSIIGKWKDRDIRDLLTFAHTLPPDTKNKDWFSRLKDSLGFDTDHRDSFIPVEYRGYGPLMKQENGNPK